MKYRLKKWYPSLELHWKDKEIIVVKFNSGREYGPINKDTYGWIKKAEVEDNPEYWEKIVEKEYEILSFIHDGSYGLLFGYTVKMQNGRLDDLIQNIPESHYLEAKCWNIYSVKKLSDNTTFTINDTIRCTNPKSHLNVSQKIKGFTINDEGSCIVHTNLTNDNGLNINKIEHCKEVLFTTEDGVDIKEGDEYYYVDYNFNLDNKKYYGKLNFNPTGICFGKLFSTKQAAEQYVALHKKQFSLKDLQDFINKNNG